MKYLACTLMCLSVVFLAGCQDTSNSAPPLAKVSGTVSLDGMPMEGGEVRFSVSGQPTRSIEIKGGSFSGEAFVGENQVAVLWEKDGPPHPMDPSQRIKENVVDAKFSGPNSPFKQKIDASGATDLKFEVTSARK